ncbi:hypothetical protein EDB89DRAFT_2067853 [Lactarius sanguifluus]|nr:hypothetical protein EDB89DRAFT_2077508 [Lactarius sanguifluus]KAH9174201.1 hypothetical protein EDB89DRAFT_2067853 [Lactarius sanguifluus]
MALLIEKHERQLTAASEPTGSPHRDEPMDVDASPSSDGHASQGLLPFPGNVVNGAHEVAHHDLTNLSRAGLRELCDTFRLAKTGNKTTLTDRLKNFSADRQGWDGLLAGARKKHRGPRDGGVTKSTKGPGKKASTKKRSTLRRELLFSAAAAGTGSTTQPCLPTERSKDMRTDEERAAVLVWARNFVACNPYKPPEEPENESSPPDVGRDWDGVARVHGDVSNAPSSPSPEDAHAVTMDIPVIAAQLQLQLQQVQAQLAALMAAIAGGNGGGVAPSPVTVVSAPAPAPAHRGPGTMDSATTTTDTAATTATTTDGPSPPTSSHQRPPTPAESVLQGPLDYLKLGNGRSLCFEKQSVPDPPLVSFAKDLPRLMRTWDDSSPEWTPSEAVLRIQGEPIALKHWPTVYRYGKSGQWACTKKNWAHWRDIATSWQELTETGFWQKFTADGQPMSYTAICEALKEERMAADRCLAEQAKDKYGDGFGAAFEYRRGSQHIVRNKSSAIAKHYRSLHVSSD